MEDIVIIGGGICGCSLLYELSRYKTKVLLLEKENDIAIGSTKANTAIVHAGYDPEPNTKMAKYNVLGNVLIQKMCVDLDVLFKRIGSLVVGFDETDRKTIEKLLEKGIANGVKGLRIIERDEMFEMEPNLNREALCALYAPSAGIISPWELAIAQAECAVKGGAKVQLNAEVKSIKKEKDYFILETSNGEIESKYVINAAGTSSDLVSQMIEDKFFEIHSKSGEYFLLDTTESGIVNTTVFPCPSALGKGILVSPTIHGNVIVGPDSKSVERGHNECTAAGLAGVKKGAMRLIPNVNVRASIRNFAGIRADAGLEDFIVGESDKVSGFFNIAAIKSPGLTSAPAIAKDIVSALKKKKDLKFEANPKFVSKRKVVRFKHLEAKEKETLIKKNPLYGTIICRCQTITEGEIVDALRRPLPPHSLDAVKRRCSSGMGRCQGGFCGPRVQALISRELQIKENDIPLDRADMYIITGKTKNEKEGSL